MSVDAPSSILILRLSSLGDVVHAIPAVHSLRARWGSDVPIGWVVEKPYASLVRTATPADEVFRVDTRRWRSSILSTETTNEVVDVVRRLRRFSKGGWSLDLQGLVKSATFGWLARARQRFGFDRASAKEGLSLLFTNRRVSVEGDRHVIDLNLELARAAGGIEVDSPFEGIERFPDDPRGIVVPLVEEEPIVILPGAGRGRKIWPADSWIDLTRELTGDLGIPVIVVWGPGEREGAARIAATGGGMLAPQTDLRELGMLLARARLVIGGDTGPLHLAEALGSPVVALHGPTEPERNGPWRQQNHVLRATSRRGDMSSIEVRSVIEMVRGVLDS